MIREIIQRSGPAYYDLGRISAQRLLERQHPEHAVRFELSSGAATRSGEGPTALGVRPDANVPEEVHRGLFHVFAGEGPEDRLCYGPQSDPCADTKDYSLER